MFGRTITGNESIPQTCVDTIADAIDAGKPAIFHAGCIGCIWRHMNTTHEGIPFCRDCLYFAWNRKLPDKSRRHSRRS